MSNGVENENEWYFLVAMHKVIQVSMAGITKTDLGANLDPELWTSYIQSQTKVISQFDNPASSKVRLLLYVRVFDAPGRA